jgi:hypothetical protein
LGFSGSAWDGYFADYLLFSITSWDPTFCLFFLTLNAMEFRCFRSWTCARFCGRVGGDGGGAAVRGEWRAVPWAKGVASVYLTVSRTLVEIAEKISFFAGFLGFSKPIEWGFWGVSGA